MARVLFISTAFLVQLGAGIGQREEDDRYCPMVIVLTWESPHPAVHCRNRTAFLVPVRAGTLDIPLACSVNERYISVRYTIKVFCWL